MSKKYSKAAKAAVEASIAEEIKNIVENPVEEIMEEPEEEINQYTDGSDKLLEEIDVLPNGEERSRAIKDLEVMHRIAAEHSRMRIEKRRAQLEEERAELEKEKMEYEEKMREADLELRKEEVKSIKRNGLIGNVVSILGTALSFVFYGALIDKQNKFEMRGETVTSAGGKDLSRHTFDFGRFKRS